MKKRLNYKHLILPPKLSVLKLINVNNLDILDT